MSHIPIKYIFSELIQLSSSWLSEDFWTAGISSAAKENKLQKQMSKPTYLPYLGTDSAFWVVSADSGVQPQTYSCLESWQNPDFSQWKFGLRSRPKSCKWGASASAVGLFCVLRSLAIISMLTEPAHWWKHQHHHRLLKYYRCIYIIVRWKEF